MTHMIQVCSDFHRMRAFIMHTRPVEIARLCTMLDLSRNLLKVGGVGCGVECWALICWELGTVTDASARLAGGDDESGGSVATYVRG